MKFLATALLVGCSVSAFAQNSLSGVTGTVSVTSGQQTTGGSSSTILKNGDIVTASAGASTTVKVGNCSVSLTPGQSLVVDTALPCDRLQASVKTITVPSTSFASGFPGGPVGLGLGIVAGGLAINKLVKKDDTTNVIAAAPTPTPIPTPTPAPITVTQPPKPSGS